MTRALFEAFLLANTGRDMDYHTRAQTTGLELAWEAWQSAQASPDVRIPTSEPAGWMTENDGGPMYWPTHKEASAYCDDGEEPVPLYTAQAMRDVTLAEANEAWRKVDEGVDFLDALQAFVNGRNAIAQPAPPVQPAEPLTMEQVFASADIMAVNASIGLRIDQIMRIVNAVEQAHGIKGTT